MGSFGPFSDYRCLAPAVSFCCREDLLKKLPGRKKNCNERNEQSDHRDVVLFRHACNVSRPFDRDSLHLKFSEHMAPGGT